MRRRNRCGEAAFWGQYNAIAVAMVGTGAPSPTLRSAFEGQRTPPSDLPLNNLSQ